MRDSTILMILTTLILLAFRYLRHEDSQYDDGFIRTRRKSKTQSLDQMVTKYNQVIAKYPTDASAYCDRGAAYIRIKRYSEALTDLNKAIEFQPTYADAFNNRGVAYYRLAQFEQSVNDFTTAILHVSDDATYYLNRGTSYKQIKYWQQADADIERALDLNPRLIGIVVRKNGNQQMTLEDTLYDKQIARSMFLSAEILIVKFERQIYFDKITAE